MAAQPGPQGDKVQFSEHYKRLQSIEQHIVAAVRAAGEVMAELARAADADRARLLQLAAGFMEQVQAAQQLLLSAVRGAVAERCFEASVYHNMAAAAAALEQVNAADVHLRGLQALISAHRRRDELARAAHAAAAADGGGGGGGDALMLDGDGGGLGV